MLRRGDHLWRRRVGEIVSSEMDVAIHGPADVAREVKPEIFELLATKFAATRLASAFMLSWANAKSHLGTETSA